jgi:hypothetical protein
MNTDRASILTDYRARIAAGERTRLRSAESESLIAAFIGDLKELQDQESIQARCQEEIAMLEEGYPRVTIASRILAPYRRAIRAAVEAGTLPLTEDTSYPLDGGSEHAALVYLKYDREVYEELRQDTKSTNNARLDDLQPIVVDSYLAKVTTMLADSDPLILTAAIAAATGRRHTEVVARGVFEPTAHPYVLRFAGQQKKHGDTAPYDILTLVPASSILAALARLRAHPYVAPLAEHEVNDSVVRGFNVQVNREVKTHFEDTGLVPKIAGAQTVSIHRLRGIYGAIAVHLWCPPSQHESRFMQHYLGHEENSQATEHYQHYRLLDGDGQPLHAKGILRAQFPLPETGPATPAAPQDAPAAPQAAPAAPAAPTIDGITLHTLHDQAKTLSWLTDEITSLRQQLAAAQQDAEAGRAWRSERSIMQAKIDSLAGENLILQRRLERFENIRALLNNGEAPAAPQATQDAPEAPAAPAQATPAAPAQAAPAAPTQAAPTGRRSPADERVALIWKTIQEWNNAPNRPIHDKVVLTNTLLEREFKVFRPAIKRFTVEHAAEIAAHHERHGLTSRPTHNRDLAPNILEEIKQLVMLWS